MAVQAQYPSNVPSMTEQERNSMDYTQMPPVFMKRSIEASVFYPNGATATTNLRKRGREAAAAEIPTAPPPPPLSTGIRLALEDHQQNQSNPLLPSFIDGDQEMDRFLCAQGEQLRRTMAEASRRHYKALLLSAANTAARRLREKEAELERAASRGAELEDRLARLTAESQAWQAKVTAQQSAAAYLHAQLQAARAAAPPPDEVGESRAAEDAESAHINPDHGAASCRGCWRSPASVVLLPCRHLCLCGVCGVAAQFCVVCGCVSTGGVEVFLS